MRQAPFLALLMLSAACLAPPALAVPQCHGADGYAADFGGRQTYLWRADALAAVKAQIAKDPASVPAYAALIRDADAAMTAGPWSVTAKTKATPSGDIHDYMSIGPYFWPDPSKPDGLPYINRDGQVNPERATEAYDRTRLGDMSSAVEALGLAYYFTDDDKYAKRAALILKTWFVDSATRMNPNFNFAQGVPGKTPGRSFGIIDSVQFVPVIEAAGLIAPSHALSDTDTKSLRAWFGDFATWMTTSPNGVEERAATNNHSIYYDLELTEFSLYAGKTDQAREVVSQFGPKRLDPQMAPDGSLPRELARTRSFHYNMWAMQAAYDVATLGECVDADLWHWQTADGRGLKLGTTFAASWAGRDKDWKWQEIDMNTEDLYDALLKASHGYNDPALSQAAAVYASTYATARINLTTPLLAKP